MELRFTLEDHLPKIIKGLDNKVAQAMQATATLLEGEVNEVLRGQRHGRRYKVPNSNQTYTASAPFEAPAVRLSDLFGSYKGITEGTGSNTVAIIGTDVEYAPHLEYGTRRMAMRPHFRKTVMKNLPKVERIVRDFFE